MAKAKKKRTAKDLDKFWRTGKYWEWVQLVSQIDQINLHQAQWQEAWRYLCRQALRLPGQLEEFWGRLEAQPQAPNLPDLVFIRALKDYFTGAVLPDLGALSGLSPPAQMLRKNLLSWSQDSAQDRKISRFLNLLTGQPDKVTGKTYNDLAALVQPNPLAAALISLGKTINQIRKLNHKEGFNPHLVGMGGTELKRADNLLSRLAPAWNPTVRAALLHPFCHQLFKCLQGLWARENFDKISYLTSSVPFLCSQTFGPDAAKLRDYSRQHSEGCFSESECLTSLEQSATPDLDSLAQALGQIRKLLKSAAFDPSRRLLAKFRTGYIRLLNEISGLQPKLKLREKIALMQVMDPILFEDRDWLEDEDYFWEDFLLLAFASGVAGTRLSILALLTPASHLHPSLRKQAKENLRQLPYPGDKQIKELLLDPDILPFPDLHRVKPLFQIYPNQDSLRRLFIGQVIQNLGMLLVSSAISLKFETGNKSRQEIVRLSRQGMLALIHGLAELQEYPEIAPLQHLVACFPEGYLTPEGYQRLMQRLYESGHSFDLLLTKLEAFIPLSRLPDLADSPFLFLFASQLLQDYDNALLQFIIDHRADIETASLENIEKVIDRFCRLERLEPKAANFLLHLADLLQRRLQAGETDAEPLYDQIMSILISLRQTGSPRKRRSRK